MHVAEILAKKGSEVITVRPDDTIGHAAELLAERRFGALLVSTDGSSIDGIISERDIVRGLASASGDVRSDTVSSLMTSSVWTCSKSDSVGELMERLRTVLGTGAAAGRE